MSELSCFSSLISLNSGNGVTFPKDVPILQKNASTASLDVTGCAKSLRAVKKKKKSSGIYQHTPFLNSSAFFSFSFPSSSLPGLEGGRRAEGRRVYVSSK